MRAAASPAVSPSPEAPMLPRHRGRSLPGDTRRILYVTEGGTMAINPADLAHRAATADAHPIGAVTGLQGALDSAARPDTLVNTALASAVRAPSYLDTPTYDGSGKATHPSVVHVPGGWNGYPYWMAMTPYPAYDATKENPSILASLDGTTWVVPPGLANPVVQYVAGSNWSDPDIALDPDGDTLHMVFRKSDGSLLHVSSTDGVTWSSHTEILAPVENGNVKRMSPSVVWDGTQWVMYCIDGTVSSDRRIERRTAPFITGPWSDATTLALVPPVADRQWWHMDAVQVAPGTVHAFISTTGLEYELFFAESCDNGLTFTVSSRIFPPYTSSSIWDRYIYRSSAIPFLSGQGLIYRLWYSAFNDGVEYGNYRIGVTDVTFSALRFTGPRHALGGNVEPAGVFDVSSTDASTAALVIRAKYGQTANVFEARDFQNLVITAIRPNGGAKFGGYTGTRSSASGLGVYGHSEVQHRLAVATKGGNLVVGAHTDDAAEGGGVGIIAMRNAATVPSANVSTGGLLYVEGGALKYRGSAGTVTVIAPA